MKIVALSALVLFVFGAVAAPVAAQAPAASPGVTVVGVTAPAAGLGVSTMALAILGGVGLLTAIIVTANNSGTGEPVSP